MTTNTNTMSEAYARDGYVVLDAVLDEAALAEIKAEAVTICRGGRGQVDGLAIEADPGENDDEVMRRTLCIHFPHKVSSLVERYLSHPGIVDGLRATVGPNVKCMQSMLFIKAAGKPGQAWHQDEAFIPTRDRSLAGAWIALDDATVENGCLWVIPGSHRPGVIWPMRDHNDPRFDGAATAYGFPFDEEEAAVPVQLPAGSAVIFNGYLLHRSLPNTAPSGYRRALTLHYMSAESLLPWQGQADWRDIVMVAGEDPYAYKGLEQRSRPFIRDEGDAHNEP